MEAIPECAALKMDWEEKKSNYASLEISKNLNKRLLWLLNALPSRIIVILALITFYSLN